MRGQAEVVRVDGMDAACPYWDTLEHSLFSSENWLRTAETLAGVPARYTVLQRDGLPSSALVCWESTGEMWLYNDPVALLRLGAQELDGYLDGAARTEVDRLAAEVGRATDQLYPAHVSVLPSGYRPGLVIGSARDVPQLLDDLEGTAAPTTAVMHLDDGDSITTALLKERGYVGLSVAGDCVLELDPAWAGLEDYASVEKGRRKRVRREVTAFRAAGAAIRRADAGSLGARHAKLHAAHLRRYGHEADEDSSQRLISAIQRWPTGRPLVLEIVEDEAVTGFLVAYEWRGELFTSMVGIASEAPYAYFNLVFYEPIGRAIEAGLSRVRFGPGTYEAKRQRGCTVRSLTSHIRVPDSLAAPIARLASLLDVGYRREMGLLGD